MGHLFEQYGLNLFKFQHSDGRCDVCGMVHEPEYPHNLDSLQYQLSFFDEVGRWPTWIDAMSHCTNEIKEAWTHELRLRGIDVEERIKPHSL